MTSIILKRAYDPESEFDGYRIYVDRLWPQGLSHLTFHYDLWDKDISPSTELREWFHADPTERWAEFEKKYSEELVNNPAFKELLSTIKTHSKVTLLFSSRDLTHNNAVVVKNVLEKALQR